MFTIEHLARLLGTDVDTAIDRVDDAVADGTVVGFDADGEFIDPDTFLRVLDALRGVTAAN